MTFGECRMCRRPRAIARSIYALLSEVWTIRKPSSVVSHSTHFQFLSFLLQDRNHPEGPTRIVRNYQKTQKASRPYPLLFSFALVISVKFVFAVFLFPLLICTQLYQTDQETLLVIFLRGVYFVVYPS